MIDPACFRWPRVDDATIAALVDLVRSGQTSTDEDLFAAFEAELCAYFGVRHALLTCNGTAAAFSCYRALGLGPGTEIIGPAFTYWATLLPAVTLGARVVFADVEPDSLCLSVSDVAHKITPATRAIAVCHLCGNPADMLALTELADRHGLAIVEDISHAPGARIAGRAVGSFGDMAFVSMQASKLISAGEGGILLTDDSDLYARAVKLGHPKRRVCTPDGESLWRGVSDGYKFRISAIHALLGRAAFARLDEELAIRRDMLQVLLPRIADLGLLRPMREVPGAERVWWEYDFLLQDGLSAAAVTSRLMDRGIIAGTPKFCDLQSMPQFAPASAVPGDCPNSRGLADRVLLLAPFKQRAHEMLDEYVATLRGALTETQESGA